MSILNLAPNTLRASFVWMPVIVLCNLGCGSGAFTATTLNWSMPQQSALFEGCSDTELEADVEAVLVIGGHSDCALDAQDGSFTGQCESLKTGRVLPAALLYSLEDSGVTRTFAALLLTIDLREETLLAAETKDSVDVVLAADSESVRFLSSPEDLEQLQTDADNLSGDVVSGLDVAIEWAPAVLSGRSIAMDSDADQCSDFDEACNGTLFSNDTAACP